MLTSTLLILLAIANCGLAPNRAMVPTTRAGSKRTSSEATDAAKSIKKAKGFVENTIMPVKNEEPARETPQYFRFLDLSPELRNRVYDYAKEDDTRRFALHPIHLTSAASRRKSHSERTWKYFAITQVSKQVRAEYRPLWVRDLCVRFVSTFDLTSFVDTFLHHGSGHNHTPKLVQYSWHHGDDNITYFDMMPMLRLYAQSPSLRVAFVPSLIATNGCTVEDDICNSCMREMDEYGYEIDYEDCECPDHEWSRREWSTFKWAQMEYTRSIRNFIHNPNESWIKAVQEDKITVTCEINAESCHGTFKILCKDPVCQTTTDSQPVLDLLEQWGVFGLPVKKCTEFVMAYEDKQVTERNGRKVTNSVVRKVHVHKTLAKDQAHSAN